MTQKEPELLPADAATDEFLVIWNGRAMAAYSVYGAAVGWKNYAGLPMPTWKELPRRIRASWCLTTKSVFDATKAACVAEASKAVRDWTTEEGVKDVLLSIERVE